MKKPRRYKSCFEQVLSENPFGLEFLLLSGWLLFASIIVPGAANDGFTLQVFGNANMDDRIDEMDIDQIRKLIAGTEESLNTSLSCKKSSVINGEAEAFGFIRRWSEEGS